MVDLDALVPEIATDLLDGRARLHQLQRCQLSRRRPAGGRCAPTGQSLVALVHVRVPQPVHIPQPCGLALALVHAKPFDILRRWNQGAVAGSLVCCVEHDALNRRVRRRTAPRLSFPVDLPRARCEDATTLSRPNGFDSEPPASTQRARRTTSLSSASVVSSAKNGLHGKRSEQEFFARLRRAALRERGANSSRPFAVVELPGPPRTTRRYSRNRGLQPRGLLAQSRRRICFIPGDEGIVVPVCVADTPKRPRTRQRRPASQSCGSSSQLGHQCPSRSRPLPGFVRATAASCGTHHQRQRTDNNLRQTQSFHARHKVLGKAEP